MGPQCPCLLMREPGSQDGTNACKWLPLSNYQISAFCHPPALPVKGTPPAHHHSPVSKCFCASGTLTCLSTDDSGPIPTQLLENPLSKKLRSFNVWVNLGLELLNPSPGTFHSLSITLLLSLWHVNRCVACVHFHMQVEVDTKSLFHSCFSRHCLSLNLEFIVLMRPTSQKASSQNTAFPVFLGLGLDT